MAAAHTSALAAQLSGPGELIDFVEEFEFWKVGGASTEYDSYLFGKDGEYGKLPPGLTSGELRHVHLVPLADVEALKKWDKAWERASRKTSDRALVYAENNRGDYLLIYILDEPDAHGIAAMKTTADQQLMQGFVKVAETWAFSGKITA